MPYTPSSNTAVASAPEKGVVLTRELQNALIALTIALSKHASYPRGHPLLDGAIESLRHRLSALLLDREMLTIGVARQQLVIEGVATDSANPLLRSLAKRLHDQHLGAVRFVRGIPEEELGEAVALLASDPGSSPIGLRNPDSLPRWSHVRFFPLAFDHLELIDGTGDAPISPDESDGKKTRHDGHRANSLWIGLARAAMMATPGAAPEEAEEASSPLAVARAIEHHRGHDDAYDQVVVGYLHEILQELRLNEGPEVVALQKRISSLVKTLEPEALKKLLEMGGDIGQRRKFVKAASQHLTVDAVLELAKAAADTSKLTLSNPLLGLLTKLASHSHSEQASVRDEAESSLREHMEKLVSTWSPTSQTSERYRMMLEAMSHNTPEMATSTATTHYDPAALIATAIEVYGMSEAVLDAVDAMLARGRLGEVLDWLDVPEVASGITEQIWTHVCRQEVVYTMLETQPIDFAVLERLVKHMGVAGAEPLIEALSSAESRTTRSRLLTMLVDMGAPMAPAAIARLEGTPWYVQRNMLDLLTRIGEWPDTFNPIAWAAHQDARVRRQAMKMVLRDPRTRDQALPLALTDADEGILRMGLTVAFEHCPPDAMRIVMMRLDDEAFPTELRAMCLRVVSVQQPRRSVDELLQRAVNDRIFLGARLKPKSAEMLAALAGLAADWRTDARAARALERARKHPDGEVRTAAAATRTVRSDAARLTPA